MPVFRPGETGGDLLATEAERVKSLLADMERILDGHLPETIVNDEPPVLDHWNLINRPAPCLVGLSTLVIHGFSLGSQKVTYVMALLVPATESVSLQTLKCWCVIQSDMEFPDIDWSIATPEETGWSADLLAKARMAALEFGSIAAAAVHRGRLVGFGGDLAQKVMVRSVRKSLLNALIGIEVSRDRIALDATLAELGIDDLSPLTAEERQATLAHLLTSRSGIYLPALAEDEATRTGKPARGSHPPGTNWCYNNWDFNALGTIYERATDHSVFQGFYEEIAQPLGMADFRPEDGSYLRGPESSHPAYHMHLSARDLARFGLLFLNEGRWKEKQVVPSWWVRESTRVHATTPTGDGYGYMWWTTGHNGEAGNRSTAHLNRDLPTFRYFARGAYGQMIGIMPERDLVIVHLGISRERSPEINRQLGDFVRLVAKAVPR